LCDAVSHYEPFSTRSGEGQWTQKKRWLPDTAFIEGKIDIDETEAVIVGDDVGDAVELIDGFRRCRLLLLVGWRKIRLPLKVLF
jgi:hypothetical protein